jgi:hypothetical protein
MALKKEGSTRTKRAANLPATNPGRKIGRGKRRSKR